MIMKMMMMIIIIIIIIVIIRILNWFSLSVT